MTQSTFDLNAFLADDSNLQDRVLKNMRAKQAAGIWGLDTRYMKYIKCADGLEFSAQASEAHYCSPRKNIGPYVSVEIGFPNQPVPEFMQWAEEPDNPTKTVYGWVPVDVVEHVVNMHGGLHRPQAV
jgi:hypothetical protein